MPAGLARGRGPRRADTELLGGRPRAAVPPKAMDRAGDSPRPRPAAGLGACCADWRARTRRATCSSLSAGDSCAGARPGAEARCARSATAALAASPKAAALRCRLGLVASGPSSSSDCVAPPLAAGSWSWAAPAPALFATAPSSVGMSALRERRPEQARPRLAVLWRVSSKGLLSATRGPVDTSSHARLRMRQATPAQDRT